MTHGERVPGRLCAGCRRPIGAAETLDLIDGNRVHDRPDNACLIWHGERWRAAASRALIAFGLEPPEETQLSAPPRTCAVSASPEGGGPRLIDAAEE
jgi:hypothetical protein